MLKRSTILPAILCLALGLSGCATSGHPQGQVAMMDVSERSHLDGTLNMTDLLALAEKLTNDLLMSDVVVEWGNKRPRLVIGQFVNRSDDDNIPEEEIYDRVKGLILDTGIASIVSPTSNKIDYILHGHLSSTQQYGSGGSSTRHYRVTLDLSTIDGEILASKQGQIKLGKSSRPLW